MLLQYRLSTSQFCSDVTQPIDPKLHCLRVPQLHGRLLNPELPPIYQFHGRFPSSSLYGSCNSITKKLATANTAIKETTANVRLFLISIHLYLLQTIIILIMLSFRTTRSKIKTMPTQIHKKEGKIDTDR